MSRRNPSARIRTLHFHKLIHAPLSFVYAWCTDYREDDDRITNSIYHYRARIALREPTRIVRIIIVPGRDRNRSTEVEIISLMPPNRWRLEKMSVTDDKTGEYRLLRKGPQLTALEMRFRETWKIRVPPDRKKYRVLFDRVWDRYVETMESEYRDPGAT
ncbi:MAG: hypothetical protein WCA77_01605 [Thermoplasmata archaeon]